MEGRLAEAEAEAWGSQCRVGQMEQQLYVQGQFSKS